MLVNHPNGTMYIIYQVETEPRPIWNIRREDEAEQAGGYFSLASLLNMKGWGIWEAKKITDQADIYFQMGRARTIGEAADEIEAARREVYNQMKSELRKE